MDKKLNIALDLNNFLISLKNKNETFYNVVEKFIKKNFNYLDNFQIKQKIGEGAFALVFKLKGSNKVLKLSTYATDNQLKELKYIIAYKKDNPELPYQNVYYFEALEKNHLFILITDKYEKMIDPIRINIFGDFRFGGFSNLVKNTYSFEEFFNILLNDKNFNQIFLKENKNIYGEFYHIYKTFQRLGLRTDDIHKENLMLDKNNKIIVIDF